MATKHINHDLTVNSSGAAGSPALRINNLNHTSYNHGIEVMNGNLVQGESEIMVLGKTTTTKNAGYIGYYWHFVTIGHWGSNHLFRVYGSGSAVSTTNMQAPIFYDYNDTAYYVDPAGTAKVKKIWSGLDLGNTTSPRWDTSFYVAQSQHYYGHTSSQTMYLGESGNIFRLRGTLRVGSNAGPDSGMVFTAAGSANATSSFRAPYFYDSNDTGYYANPSGTSVLYDAKDGNDNGYITYQHSGSDFADGTLVATDIVSNTTNGNSYVIEVNGKSYANEPPFAFKARSEEVV